MLAHVCKLPVSMLQETSATMIAQLLIASALAFSPAPTAHLALQRPSVAVPAVPMMAGWNDPYDGGRSERGKLEVTGTSFDEKMKVRSSESSTARPPVRPAFSS